MQGTGREGLTQMRGGRRGILGCAGIFGHVHPDADVDVVVVRGCWRMGVHWFVLPRAWVFNTGLFYRVHGFSPRAWARDGMCGGVEEGGGRAAQAAVRKERSKFIYMWRVNRKPAANRIILDNICHFVGKACNRPRSRI